MAGVAYMVLQKSIIHAEGGADSILAQAVGRDFKGKISILLYLMAILIAFTDLWAARGIFIFVALMWLIPDSRITKVFNGH